MATADLPTVRLGGRRVPVVFPSWRDARLHTAAVIISVHAIGIMALGFRVSVPHILSAVIAAAFVDVAFTLRLTGRLVWPASGMLTGSGVALILRLVGMEAGNQWTWSGWHIYASVAGLSVATKFLIRHRGAHLFNPSNVGLVAAFLVLGSSVVEPLDFWWAPPGPWMLAAYLIILGGGIAITSRLALFEMAAVFWVVVATGLGVLAASGHCMIAAWSPEPVCGSAFWWVLVTSPELLVFMLFMITDPKTIPTGRMARVVFSLTLGILATLLIAPQTVEFGAKVALLGSLVILSPIRALFDRRFPAGPRGAVVSSRPRAAFVQGSGIGVGLVVVAVAIVLAGVPARQSAQAVPVVPTDVLTAIDPSSLPEVTVSPRVTAVNLEIDASQLAATLAENLHIEGEALRRADAGLLGPVATGDRLAEMQQRVVDAISTGEREVPEYSFDALVLDVAETDEAQTSAGLSFEATGTVAVVTHDALGSEISRVTSEFTATFMLRRVGGDRWLIASVVPGKT
ncbi:hypothetical protein BH23ACT5_BH23ACT5_19790 [soil metagenome]